MRLSTFALFLFLTLPLQAQIVADRPGLADGSTTVGAGTFQLETGVTLEEDDDSLLTLPTLLRFGITDAFELRVESGIIGFTSGDSDWAPVGVGFKWRVREGSVPVSVMASVQPPSGGAELGARELEASVRVVSDLDLGGGFALVPNAGVSLVEGGDPVALFAASLEYEMDNLVPFVDFEITSGDGETAAIADGGIAWIVRPDTQLDLSAGVRLSGTSHPDAFIAAGFSRRF